MVLASFRCCNMTQDPRSILQKRLVEMKFVYMQSRTS